MSRIVKFIETESRLVAAKAGGLGWEMGNDCQWVWDLGKEGVENNVLKLTVVMVA